jgi:cytochrome P450
MSLSPSFFHDDEEIFPDAMSFKPERWLEGDADVAQMEKFWNPFGMGSRSCGGRPMAYEVLYRSLANVFLRYRLDFQGCDAEYCFTEGMLEVFPQGDSTGLRVSVERWDD